MIVISQQQTLNKNYSNKKESGAYQTLYRKFYSQNLILQPTLNYKQLIDYLYS